MFQPGGGFGPLPLFERGGFMDPLTQIVQQLNQLIFLCQTLCISTSFTCAFVCFQMIIHSKNQKNIL